VRTADFCRYGQASHSLLVSEFRNDWSGLA
jgi:hypothetical protein